MIDPEIDAPTLPAGVKQAEGKTRATRVRYVVLFAACMLAVVTYIHRVGFATASSSIRGELGLSQSHLGYVMAAFMVAYGLGEVPWGFLGDRFGVRHLLTIVMLGGSATTAMTVMVVALPSALAWQLGFLIVLRFVFGLIQAGTFPSISRMLTDWMPTTERGSAQGAIWMSSRGGGFLAPMVLTPLFAWYGTWRTPILLVAGLGVIWCVAFWPWFRNRPEEMPGVNEAELEVISSGKAGKAGGHGDVPWRKMLTSWNVWALCLMYGGIGYSGNFFLTLLPDYLKTHRGLDPDTAKWLQSLPFACGIGACILGGVVSDRIIRATGNRNLGRRAVGVVGLSTAGVAILATLWARDVPTLGFLLCLTFLGNDLAMGPAWAAAADKGERFAGTLGGLMNMVASLTAALAAIVTGHLFERGHLQLPFILFAVAYAVGVICWLRVDVTRTLADSP